jgi:hypothetical protein
MGFKTYSELASWLLPFLYTSQWLQAFFCDINDLDTCSLL